MKNIRRFLITLFVLTPLLLAVSLVSEVSPETATAVAFIISLLVGFLGPKPGTTRSFLRIASVAAVV